MQLFSDIMITFGILGGAAAFFSTFLEVLDAVDNKKAAAAVYFTLKGIVVIIASILLVIAGGLLTKGAT